MAPLTPIQRARIRANDAKLQKEASASKPQGGIVRPNTKDPLCFDDIGTPHKKGSKR